MEVLGISPKAGRGGGGAETEVMTRMRAKNRQKHCQKQRVSTLCL